MIYMLDTANIKAIERAKDLYPIKGVTTNPTIVSREGRSFLPLLKDIRRVIGDENMLHVQTLGLKAEDIIAEAEYLKANLGENIYIKIPVIPEGIKAIRILKDKGFNITATAIFTSQQALMAAVSGADFLAPYVNRIDNISGNGVEVVKDIINEINSYGLHAKVLAASFKNVQQVHELAKAGVHSVTVSPDILDAMIHHPLTDWSVEQFVKDWEKLYGEGKLTKDVSK